jgi:hypothetical protein
MGACFSKVNSFILKLDDGWIFLESQVGHMFLWLGYLVPTLESSSVYFSILMESLAIPLILCSLFHEFVHRRVNAS